MIFTTGKKTKKKKTKKAKESEIKAPIEDGSKAKPYKRVIAINLPSDLQSIDAVTCKFYRC